MSYWNMNVAIDTILHRYLLAIQVLMISYYHSKITLTL